MHLPTLILLALPLISAAPTPEPVPGSYNPANAVPYCNDVQLNRQGQWSYEYVLNSGYTQRVTSNRFPACKKGSKPDYVKAREDRWRKQKDEFKPMFPELAEKVGRKNERKERVGGGERIGSGGIILTGADGEKKEWRADAEV